MKCKIQKSHKELKSAQFTTDLSVKETWLECLRASTNRYQCKYGDADFSHDEK